MIRGIGIDLIEIERIEAALNRRGAALLRRLFTEREQVRIEKALGPYKAIHVAGRFAAKEAVVKALGTGFGEIEWKDVEIVNDPSGKPVVVLRQEVADKFDNPHLLLSISHSKMHATAVCIWED
jgi:holo-[acyl-carrier protein] synthase